MAKKMTPAIKKSSSTTPAESKGMPANPQALRKMLLIGGAIIVGIVIIYLLSRGSKAADPMAAFMPADTVIYVHVDLNELTSTEVQEITEAFQVAAGEEVTEGDAYQQEIGTALGLDYEQYISPWLGNQLGAGFYDLTIDETGGESDGKFLVVIESRDAAAADAFLDELAASAEEDGQTVTSSEFQGVRIIDLGTDFDLPAAGQGNGMVFLADSAATIQTSLDLPAAASLSSVQKYSSTVDDLASGQLFTVYMDFSELIKATGQEADLPASSAAMLESSVFTLGASVVSAGIQLEYVFQVDEAQMPPATIDLLRAATQPLTSIERFPEGTILFLGTRSTGFSPDAMRENMGEEVYFDYQESMDALSASMGVDINNLLVALDGEISLGLFPQTSGVGAFTGGYGAQLVLMTSHDSELATFLADLVPLFGSMDMTPEPRSIANMSAYAVSSPFGGDLLAFGSGSGLGFLTTDANIIEDSSSASFVSFTESDAFENIRSAIGSNGHPVFYVDVARILALSEVAGISMDESANGIRPLTAVAGAIKPYQGGTINGVMLFFIDR